MNKEIYEKFIKQPANLKMGAGKLSKRWNCSIEDVYEAKYSAKKAINNSQVAVNKVEVPTIKKETATYIGSTTSDTSALKMFQSPTPLSPEQILELVKVDGVSSEVSKIVDRLTSNGTWTYSVEVKYRKGFYNRKELKERISEIFPIMTPVSLPVVHKYSEKALVVLLSDDHAGALNKDSLYGNKWDGTIYAQRLLHISAEIKRLNQSFEEVHILSLGDQMNGFNQQTTRGGHQVLSTSNKEQFDIYTSARRLFYDDLFMSGVAKDYFVHDVENSNHTGNDFSYMANKLLETYLETKFPTVKRKSYFLPIEHFHYGIHTIGFGHGKDEKLMFRPMPLKLDPRTDLLLFQYFDNKGVSPRTRRVTMYKGDLHSYAMDKGKFGRYINIPSIMGSTDYTEINFGDTEAGAVLEVYEKFTKNVQHIPIWF